MAKQIGSFELDHTIQQPKDIILKDGELAIGGATVEPAAPDALHDGYADELAFMEEPIEVMVMETTDENAINPVTVGVNGIFKQFFRGQPTVAKRKFVDALIVKSSRVSTPKVRNGAGEDTYAIRQQSAHQYPFTVIRDNNPRGAEWLRRRMADII